MLHKLELFCYDTTSSGINPRSILDLVPSKIFYHVDAITSHVILNYEQRS